jgi:hypothetical protein
MIYKNSFTNIPMQICVGTFLAILLMSGSCASQEKTKKNKNGFIKIFDGKTLKGWEGDPT